LRFDQAGYARRKVERNTIMRKRIVSITWGVGLLIATWLIWKYYQWTYIAYRAVGYGLDPRGLLPFLALITLAVGGYNLYRGITGRDPFDSGKKHKTGKR
jgi:hypothetical protein